MRHKQVNVKHFFLCYQTAEWGEWGQEKKNGKDSELNTSDYDSYETAIQFTCVSSGVHSMCLPFEVWRLSCSSGQVLREVCGSPQ